MDGVKIYENVDGKRYSSFLSGGKIKKLYMPSSVDALTETIRFLERGGEKYFVVGNGTNTLISDDGVENVVCTKKIKSVEIDGEEVTASCGVTLRELSFRAAEKSLSGIEALSGIPGTVGGAIRMNAGAYGVEIGDLLTEITVLHGGIVEKLSKNDVYFSYRGGIVKDKEYVVLFAKLLLRRGERKDIEKKIAEIFEKRKASQPSEPSLGSTFKKVDGVSAAYYIDALKLKGYSVGNAAVSEKHAGFIVNTGNATSGDYITLSDEIIEKVGNSFGINLEREIEIIGKI